MNKQRFQLGHMDDAAECFVSFKKLECFQMLKCSRWFKVYSCLTLNKNITLRSDFSFHKIYIVLRQIYGFFID